MFLNTLATALAAWLRALLAHSARKEPERSAPTGHLVQRRVGTLSERNARNFEDNESLREDTLVRKGEIDEASPSPEGGPGRRGEKSNFLSSTDNIYRADGGGTEMSAIRKWERGSKEETLRYLFSVARVSWGTLKHETTKPQKLLNYTGRTYCLTTR